MHRKPRDRFPAEYEEFPEDQIIDAVDAMHRFEDASDRVMASLSEQERELLERRFEATTKEEAVDLIKKRTVLTPEGEAQFEHYLDQVQDGKRFTLEEATDFKELASLLPQDKDDPDSGVALVQLVAGLVYACVPKQPVDGTTLKTRFGRHGLIPLWRDNVPFCTTDCPLYPDACKEADTGHACVPAVRLCCVKPDGVDEA